MSKIFSYLKSDIAASVVVFFVALPLCLGIALASGAPPFAGLLAGIIGGVVVGSLSASRFGVSGPAAGLVAIVLTAIPDLGGYEYFLTAVVLAGVLQLIFGVLKMGIISQYFPSSVIKGMLTGIGILIILKEIPHALGYDKDFEGDESFLQLNGENTISSIMNSLEYFSLSVIILSVLCFALILLWDNVVLKKVNFLKVLPGSLVVVILGVAYVIFTENVLPEFAITGEHLVSIPLMSNFGEFKANLVFPNFSNIFSYQVWVIAFTIAVIASIETLLCLEAADKLDPYKGITPPNRELMAQGAGNIVAGLIGGLPITQVIVRSSANIQSGAKSKMSAILHGFLLLICVLLIPFVLNKIPFATLAVILILVGYKLAKPAIFKEMYAAGWKQFVPFIITIVGIVFSDLLTGIALGLVASIFIIIYKSYQNTHFTKEKDEDGIIYITLAEELTFFNKSPLLDEFAEIPNGSKVILDKSHNVFLDYDVAEIIEDFKISAVERNIDLKIIEK